jgi:hypothetical protein
MKNQIQLAKAMTRIRHWLIPLALAVGCFALSPAARAVDPPPDGGYANGNTAEGTNALYYLTTGLENTAAGFEALFGNTEGSENTAIGIETLGGNMTGVDNTAVGAYALNSNTSSSSNTAVGYRALYYNNGFDNVAVGAVALQANTIGDDNTALGVGALTSNTSGDSNTAEGWSALYNNTTGVQNTADGLMALFSNTTGNYNTADGVRALFLNTSGFSNSATGVQALYNNTIGSENTAQGYSVLYSNTSGGNNTAQGFQALYSNTTGGSNTAVGLNALFANTTGNNNIALGFGAGLNRTTGSNNIDIGNAGAAGKSNVIRIGTNGTQKNTYIAGISGVTVAGGVGVIIDSGGHLGTVVSSERFKDAIKPMDKASEAILALKPVTFRYKQELDPEGIPQFGLVAEQVENVNPDLVARDDQGKPYSVRYEAVNAMLLNEFLKEHCKVEEQQAMIIQLKSAVTQQQSDFQGTAARQQKQIEALTAGLQKVSAQVEMSKFATGRIRRGGPAPRVVSNDE